MQAAQGLSLWRGLGYPISSNEHLWAGRIVGRRAYNPADGKSLPLFMDVSNARGTTQSLPINCINVFSTSAGEHGAFRFYRWSNRNTRSIRFQVSSAPACSARRAPLDHKKHLIRPRQGNTGARRRRSGNTSFIYSFMVGTFRAYVIVKFLISVMDDVTLQQYFHYYI